jgi:hypothetical protein
VLIPAPHATNAATTTTIAAHAEVPETSEKSKWWVWVLGLLVLVALGAGIYVLASRHSEKAGSEQAWHARLVPVRRDAGVTRDLLDATAGTTIDAARLASLRRQVDTTSLALGDLTTGAPDDIARSTVAGAAEALRGYMFAIEADQLLRNGPSAPNADALERADTTRRGHATALTDALARLDELIAAGAR